jgi:hypothetical protein
VLRTSFGLEYGNLSIRRDDIYNALAILKSARISFRKPHKS